MKLDRFLCFMFFVHGFGLDHAQTTPFFEKTANRKFRLIYSELIWCIIVTVNLTQRVMSQFSL